MARPRVRSVTAVSLFPFMSVLVCAMGALIVVIGAQNILAVGTADLAIELVGSERGKQPVFVECARGGVVIHPERTQVPQGLLRRDANSAFADLLDTLELSEGRRYLVLLVRPEGIESYQRAMDMATRVWSNVGVGKDALPPGGDVIFTVGAGAESPQENGRRQP